jgi:DNA polymerase V
MSRFALVDCNNFYASCERVFQPGLEKKPVIVLSNNDGCVIARSNESKKLGIGMANPFFRIKRLCQQHDVQVFSSNYRLYGDMSQRVMSTLENFCPDMEMYSIDEAFLDLSHFQHLNPMGFGAQIKNQVKQHTGIPVCVGIAPTKTLAKMANHIAKQRTQLGVFDLSHKTTQQYWLKQLPVGDIWGVGKRWNQELIKAGIHTALELKMANTSWLRKRFGVPLERLQCELHGIACHELKTETPRKSILVSRSFKTGQTDLQPISEALANHTVSACEKLRGQQSKTSSLCVFLRTNSHRTEDKQYQNSITFNLPEASADTRIILQHARQALKNLYRTGYRYQKVGIMLLALSGGKHQQSLFPDLQAKQTTHKLMQTLDTINQKLGCNKLFFAAQGINQSWKSKPQNHSPHYTTSWEELLAVS